MNLRNAGSYHIGLDLGTGSVGWCVVDDDGELYHIKGKPTWGSRLFPSADTAAGTRVKRGQRRRYDRRRARLDCLQSLFLEEMDKVDPEFFVRMNQSRLLEEDRDPAHTTTYDHPFFNGTDFTEWDYYDKFPTIYHLRAYLMECDEKADIRLVYLALHNIVKYRGNFLHEGENLSAANANASKAAGQIKEALEDYLSQLDAVSDIEVPTCEVDERALQKALDERGVARGKRAENIQQALGCSNSGRDLAKAISRACVGYKVEFANIFSGLEKQEGTNFELSNDEKVEEFLSLCPDDGAALFEALQSAYSAYVLSDLLRGQSSLSAAMVDSYEQHKHDLKQLKGLVKDYLGMDVYNELFRGPKDADGDYNINKLPKGSYTAYIEGETLANRKGCTQEDLVKNIRKTCEKSADLQRDPRFLDIHDRLYADDGEFLAKQKTRANGAIPYQLHLEEMDAIIENQGRYYPFLLENKELMEKLVSSRIPYYVGPLNAGHDPAENGYPGNPIDADPDSESGNGRRKFAWSVRKPGMEGAEAHPWNYDEVIDTDETAERFIQRMTGTCTYLYGEPVLPRHSLLYEEFCVLNELNGARWAEGDQKPERFDWRDRDAIMEDLFRGRKGVSHKAVANWFLEHRGFKDVRIEGTQGETGFESKLDSYNDFCKILGVRRLEDDDCPLTTDEIEEIILWNTVFEDRDIFKRKLQQKYGDVLTPEQINKLVKKRYQGWGNLSRKFLCEIKTYTPRGSMGIIDILREGDPTTGHHNQAMTMMEILHEEAFGFEDLIDQENKRKFGEDGNKLSVDDLPGSPANRRTVNQAMRIVEELVGIAGHDPTSIVIEVTRDDDPKMKGKRTTKRYNQLKDALAAYKRDVSNYDKALDRELSEKQGALSDDRLMLYFSQAGKCMYSGESLDINRLNQYHIDHIIPQAYIKDDSLDNRVLVKSEENERKLDSMLLSDSIIHAQRGRWEALKEAGLISDRKFANLTRTHISENAMKGFIRRQLVETSQIVKFTRQMCEQEYPDTQIISLRASLSHNLRERCDFVKCRELNDYHHAHDAYIACQMSRFIDYRYPGWQDDSDVTAHIAQNYIKKLAAQGKGKGRRDPGSAGFFVDSFLRDGFDRETGEVFQDEWDHSYEVGKIAHALDMKQCFISRMPEEQTGAFWKETIHSPKEGPTDRLAPLKGFRTNHELNPSKYGGYSMVQQAYCFIFRARDGRGRFKYFFEDVPIHLVADLKTVDGLTSYAESIAINAGCSEVEVLRSKVPLRQKFELDGTEYYLYGTKSGNSKEIRPASQISLNNSMTALVYRALNEPESINDSEYSNLYSQLSISLKVTCPELSEKLKLPSHKAKFEQLTAENKSKIIKNVLAASKGDSQGCDLTSIGGGSKDGYLGKSIGSTSVLPRITWIDQSVTGIFETRTTLEDMQKNLR